MANDAGLLEANPFDWELGKLTGVGLLGVRVWELNRSSLEFGNRDFASYRSKLEILTFDAKAWNPPVPLVGAHGCETIPPSLLHLPLLLALAGLPGHMQLPWLLLPSTCNCYSHPC